MITHQVKESVETWRCAIVERIKLRAAEVGISMAEVGRRAGLDTNTFVRWRSRHTPRLEAIVKVAEVLMVSPEWLAGGGKQN